MEYTRRDLGFLLPLAAAAAAKAQTNKALPAKVYKYEDMPVKANGANKSRAVFDGQTHSGYHIDLHMTELGPGQAPHPPHTHVHEEVLMLHRGVLDIMYGGQTIRATTGSVIYMESNLEHGWKNPGPEPAEYFVIALGGDKA